MRVPRRLEPSCSIEDSVPQGCIDVRCGNRFPFVQRGMRSGQCSQCDPCPSGKPPPLDAALELVHGFRFPMPLHSELLACAQNAFSGFRGGHCRRSVAACGGFQVDGKAVDQGTGEALQVVAYLCGRAPAPPLRVEEITTWTRVGRGRHQALSGKLCGACCPCQIHHPLFQRNPEGFNRWPRPFRQFVEQQQPAVRQRQLPRKEGC